MIQYILVFFLFDRLTDVLFSFGFLFTVQDIIIRSFNGIFKCQDHEYSLRFSVGFRRATIVRVDEFHFQGTQGAPHVLMTIPTS